MSVTHGIISESRSKDLARSEKFTNGDYMERHNVHEVHLGAREIGANEFVDNTYFFIYTIYCM